MAHLGCVHLISLSILLELAVCLLRVRDGSGNYVGSVGCMAIIKSIVVRPLPVFLAKTAVRCVVLHV